MPTSPGQQPSARRPPQAVTTARRSVEADRRKRMRNYLVAMGIRTLAFPLTLLFFHLGWMVPAWIAAGCAIVLPPVAVMIANAVDHRSSAGEGPQSPVRELGTGTEASEPQPGKDASPGPIEGVVVPPKGEDS